MEKYIFYKKKVFIMISKLYINNIIYILYNKNILNIYKYSYIDI